MNFRSAVIGTWTGHFPERVVWQPRLEHWYHTRRREGTLPERYREMSLLDLYRDLGCSLRPYWMFNPTFVTTYTPEITIERRVEDGIEVTHWHTPLGDLVQRTRRTALAWHTLEYPVKTEADMRVMEYLLTHRTFRFDQEAYQRHDALLGDLGAPMCYLPRMPLQRLFIEIMGIERTLYALHDTPGAVEHLMCVIEESEEPLYELVKQCPIQIINFGDNVHGDLVGHTLFEKYLQPYYRRRCEQLHAAGKWVYPHWDGGLRAILRYARECGFDGYEALTPVPPGDVTLEEIKEALGDDLVLLDGIPMTCFLPETPLKELEAITLRILELFAPRLILGISDEISPPGDIERVRFVSEIVAGWSR